MLVIFLGIRVVGKGSWKKREVGKFDMNLERMKLESFHRSLKVRAEVGKVGLNLESTTEVGKFELNLERSIEVGKLN